MIAVPEQGSLFEAPPPLPEGFAYEPRFLSPEEEGALVARIAALPLADAKYKDYTARRRIVSYGGQYDFKAGRLELAPPIPGFLAPLRRRIARWAAVSPDDFVQALVTEYSPGTPLGWHRDVPEYERIVGVSLAGRARMRLRPYRPGEKQRRSEVVALDLAPRSAYAMTGPARWAWQHCISETHELRYSITFRTARG